MDIRGRSSGDENVAQNAEISTYLQEQFGDRMPVFLYAPDAHQRLFGHWLKIVRESRPPDERVTVGKRARRPYSRRGKARATQPAQDQRSRCLSQSSLAERTEAAWKVLFQEEASFDDRYIRRLEAGEQPSNRRLILSLAVALRADKYEIAILYDAAGYNGWDWYKTEMNMARSNILSSMERGAKEHEWKKLTPADILHVMKLRMDAEIRDAQP